MLCIMARSGKAGWSGTPEEMWNSKAFQIRLNSKSPKDFEDFMSRLEAGEIVSAGIITVWKHKPEDVESLNDIKAREATEAKFCAEMLAAGGKIIY